MVDESERVGELFAHAAALPAAERAELLDRECGASPATRAELESLLDAHDRAGDFLERVDAAAAHALIRSAAGETGPEPAPSRVGPWRVVGELGRGGMGVVYLAERVEGGFEQRVALKRLAPSAVSETILRRFLAERQILARLEHPNVARLVDGGLAEDGWPYFAMERVDGEPVTTWCDARRLPVEQRLRLFLRILGAVQYAHANLVVHRDLKPSNILVTADGEPKLLDFGIAEVPGDEAEGADPAAPAGGPAALTPEYASPEQLTGAPATTASDVYSLGVVLYELLAGRRPHAFARRALGVLAAASAPPVPLSTAVLQPVERRAGESTELIPAGQVAAARATTPRRLARRLAGDLDAIIVRALRREPGRRYPSAEALAADLGRHLSGHAVEARRPTARYRAGRFVRRHRLGVAAAAAATLALAAGLVVAALQAQRAAREARRARAVQSFLVEVFERADPSRSLGATVSARQLLDEGARRLAVDPTTDPATRAELADTLARTYLSLGQLAEAESWARQAVAGFRQALGADQPRTALAELTAAEIAAGRGELATARAELDRLAPRLAGEFGEVSREHLRALAARARVPRQPGDLEAALADEQAVLAGLRTLLGEDDLEVAFQMGNVGEAYAQLSRFSEAEAMFRQALARLERRAAVHSPQWIWLATRFADLLDRAGRDAEADQRFRAALAAAREVFEPRHPEVAQILIKYGFLLNDTGRHAEGEAALLEAIAILEPLGHYDAAAALRYVGIARLGQERLEEARDLFARARERFRADLGDDHAMTWTAELDVAYVEGRLGRTESAIPAMRRAIAALERFHGSGSNDVRVPKKYLGEILRLAGSYAEAEQLHRWALDLERRLFGGEQTLASASTKHQLALDLLESGRRERLSEARRLADESVAFFRAEDSRPDRLGAALAASGRIAGAEGDLPRARHELDEAVELLAGYRDPDAPSVRDARAALAALPR